MTINVLVVNLNNIGFTKDCIDDLLRQNINDFKITLVDQASTESGTKEYLDSITDSRVTIVRNEINTPLNHVWNWFSGYAKEDLLCFLNNDVRIPSNFIKDTVDVFKKEETVGIAVHSTNHILYCNKLDELKYEVMVHDKHMQG